MKQNFEQPQCSSSSSSAQMPSGPRSHPSMFTGRLCSRNAFSVKSLAQRPKKTRERTCSTHSCFSGPTSNNSMYHFHFVTKHYPCDRHTTKGWGHFKLATRCSGPRLLEHHQHPTNLPTSPSFYLGSLLPM
jgi:hypothetical protein